MGVSWSEESSARIQELENRGRLKFRLWIRSTLNMHIINVSTYNPLLEDPFHDEMITTDVLTYYTVYIAY